MPQNAFKEVPCNQQKCIAMPTPKSVHEGVSFARLVALVGSGQRDSELGHFKDGIYPKLSVETHAFVGSIEAASATRNAQVKAM